MATSVAELTRGVSTFLGSLLALCFNMPHFTAPNAWAQPESTDHACIRHDRSAGFHATGFQATATIEDVGNGKERLTVWLDFDGTGHRDEDEGL
jgi:hypothetical protein